jgi:putative endonuclease
MFYFYILKSVKDSFIYYGYTNNLKRRLLEHNSGETQSTKGHQPLFLVYYEAYLSNDEAKHREHSIKLNGRAKAQLMNRIKKSVSLKP